MKKRIFKIFKNCLIIIIVTIWLLIAALNSTIVQSFLTASASKFLSNELQSKISIASVNISPFKHVALKDVLVLDKQSDTLLSVSYLEGNLKNFSFSNKIHIKNIVLENTHARIAKHNNIFNFQYIIDYFSSDKKKEKDSNPINIIVNDIKIKNLNFIMEDLDKTETIEDGIFAPNCIKITDVNMNIKNFDMKGIDMKANLENLNLKERCGIVLERFCGEINFSDKGIKLTDAEIKTHDSDILCDMALQTEGFHTYSSFIDSVDCKINIKNSSFINLKDACYWHEKIQNANQKVFINCEASGTISNMLIEKFNLRTSNTNINANGSIKGLTEVEKTVFDLNIYDITTSLQDYNAMDLGTLVPQLSLPDMINTLGVVNISGKFYGLLDDFITSLVINTDLGSVDLSASAENIGNQTKYIANISSPNLKIGSLIDNSGFQNSALDVQAELLGTNPQTMQGKLNAKLHNFYYNGNNYDKISLVGDINGYDINANVMINDELVQFDGKCAMNYDKMTFNLDADIVNLDLHRMNLIDFADTSTIITAKITSDITNMDIKSLNGSVNIEDITIKTTNKQLNIDNINLYTKNDSLNNVININSDILNANVTGQYDINTISEDIKFVLNKYIPDITAVISNEIPKKNINYENYQIQSDLHFDLNIKNIELVRSLFDLNLYLQENIDINGVINADSILYCYINIPDINYSQMEFNNMALKLKTNYDKLNLNLNIDSFNLSDSLGFNNINIASAIDSNGFDLQTLLTKQGDDNTNGHINLSALISDKGLQGNFKDTYFNIQGTHIDINDNHLIGVVNKNLSLINFIISSQNSNITIDGAVNETDALHCKFKDVDLALLNPFIESMDMKISGLLNNEVILNNVLKSFTFTSNLQADNLAINDIYLGSAWLNVDNNISPDIFNTNIKFLYKTNNQDIVPLHITGFVAPKQEEEQLNLNVNMNNFALAIINPFVSDYMSDIEGYLSCEEMKIKGKMSSPDIQGVLHTNNVAVKINMLNTKYWINDDIFITNNKIAFKDFKLKDVENNKITVNGDITHHNFSSFDLNLNAVAEKIKILDTKANSGEMYYGTAYASANVNIVGDSTMLNISGNAKTEPGTLLTVPVTSKENAMENDFIYFVNNNDTTTNNIKSKTNEIQKQSMGYNINLDLNVNPNAKLYIPMDFTQLKGNLNASGNGDLKIAMDSEGKFVMIGEVAIADGTFGFNIMDIMEKKFILQQGGTLTWNGNPTGGILNVAAIYKTKASLASILGNQYSKPVDIESIIRLSGEMTNPQPKFDINLPNTDGQTVEQVFMTIDKTDEKVMLEQTASILLTNQFYYSQGGYENDALQSGVTSSVMGVAFSQLSGIINNIMGKVVDVDLNYTSSGTGTATSDQVNAAFSKSYGKWTVILNTSFGGSNTTSTTDEGSKIIGDASLQYRYNDNLNFEVFNHSNANDFTKYNVSPYTQGARAVYKKEYNSFKDIFTRKRKKINRE